MRKIYVAGHRGMMGSAMLRRLQARQAAGETLEFSGAGMEEVATVAAIEGDHAPALKVGDVIMRIDPRYFRPAEVETLLGDPTRAREKLGWTPQITTRRLCAEMVAVDLKTAKRHALLKAHGLELPVAIES